MTPENTVGGEEFNKTEQVTGSEAFGRFAATRKQFRDAESKYADETDAFVEYLKSIQGERVSLVGFATISHFVQTGESGRKAAYYVPVGSISEQGKREPREYKDVTVMGVSSDNVAGGVAVCVGNPPESGENYLMVPLYSISDFRLAEEVSEPAQ